MVAILVAAGIICPTVLSVKAYKGRRQNSPGPVTALQVLMSARSMYSSMLKSRLWRAATHNMILLPYHT